MRGYFGIAVYGIKTPQNYGTLFRSANVFGASFISMINCRFAKQASDTMRTERHLPLTLFASTDEFLCNRPYDCQLVGVELTDDAIDIGDFTHPARAVYVLGPEDGSVPKDILSKCQHIIRIPGEHCLNLAVAGSIAMYDRVIKSRCP